MSARCHGEPVCLRVHALEPYLPIAPDWGPESNRACTADGSWCMPWIFLLGGWHSFLDEALVSPLKRAGGADVRTSCFYDWRDTRGAEQWPASFGKSQPDQPLMATCTHTLQFYPAFAGRFHSAWADAYGPCKAAELAKNRQPGASGYYERDGAMWQVCRPAALRAHDAAIGTGGVGAEATPPFALAALMGPAGIRRARIVAVVRNPSERFEASFWLHKHYQGRYGGTPDGLHKFAEEQTAAFTRCQARYGGRRCAFYFELLDADNSDVFFHCDQVIRGIYAPFLADWLSAFPPSSIRVLRAEDLLDRPSAAWASLTSFLGASAAGAASAIAHPGQNAAAGRGAQTSAQAPLLHSHNASYAGYHAAMVEAAGGTTPMASRTRIVLDAFYAPFNRELAALLGEDKFRWQRP